ncbi:MAG: hypothetical protein ACK6D3_15380 [Planctomycetaceae bacterium]|jgi:hypothetical protein
MDVWRGLRMGLCCGVAALIATQALVVLLALGSWWSEGTGAFLDEWRYRFDIGLEGTCINSVILFLAGLVTYAPKRPSRFLSNLAIIVFTWLPLTIVLADLQLFHSCSKLCDHPCLLRLFLFLLSAITVSLVLWLCRWTLSFRSPPPDELSLETGPAPSVKNGTSSG